MNVVHVGSFVYILQKPPTVGLGVLACRYIKIGWMLQTPITWLPSIKLYLFSSSFGLYWSMICHWRKNKIPWWRCEEGRYCQRNASHRSDYFLHALLIYYLPAVTLTLRPSILRKVTWATHIPGSKPFPCFWVVPLSCFIALAWVLIPLLIAVYSTL